MTRPRFRILHPFFQKNELIGHTLFTAIQHNHTIHGTIRTISPTTRQCKRFRSLGVRCIAAGKPLTIWLKGSVPLAYYYLQSSDDPPSRHLSGLPEPTAFLPPKLRSHCSNCMYRTDRHLHSPMPSNPSHLPHTTEPYPLHAGMSR